MLSVMLPVLKKPGARDQGRTRSDNPVLPRVGVGQHERQIPAERTMRNVARWGSLVNTDALIAVKRAGTEMDCTAQLAGVATDPRPLRRASGPGAQA